MIKDCLLIKDIYPICQVLLPLLKYALYYKNNLKTSILSIYSLIYSERNKKMAIFIRADIWMSGRGLFFSEAKEYGARYYA